MPPRATTETLLKLRRAEEQEAMRALGQARRAAERAAADVRAARAARDQVQLLLRAPATGATATDSVSISNTYDGSSEPERRAWAARRGRRVVDLQRAEQWRGRLREQLAEADRRLAEAERSGRDADAAVTRAQIAVERALRARQGAQRHLQLLLKTANRRQERKEQAAVEDSWRPTRR